MMKLDVLRRLPKRSVLGYSVLTLGLVGGIIAIQLNDPRTGSGHTDVPPITYSTGNPDETPISSDYAWRGTKQDLMRIEIPTIKTDAFIQKMGIDQHQQIAVP